MKVCRKMVDYKKGEGFVSIFTNCVEIRIWFLTEDILRIRAGFMGDFKEASYSLVLTGWDDAMDAVLEGERKRICPREVRVEERKKEILLQGEKLQVVVHKEPFQIEVLDEDGDVLHRDVVDLAYRQDSNLRSIHAAEIDATDHFYGFGEKSGKLNKAQSFMKMAPRDAMGYDPVETDSLYKHIPFFIKLKEDTKKAVGYFYHTTSECDFDMGREKSNYWHRHSTFRADAGDIDLFLIAGPQMRQVVERYTDLTGKSAMLPKQALGYLGSSMYYAELEENCDQAILGFMDTAEAEDIPMDGFMLSSGYTSLETEQGLKRCVFSWNEKRFPQPKEFFAQAKKRGVAISSNVKPGILTCHPQYEKMKQEGMFVLDSESDAPGIGTWWGGEGSFVDFTNANVRRMWKDYLKASVLEMGSTSVWNDNCEYDSMVDKDARCYFEGEGETIGTVKSVMSNLMCMTTREAMAEVDQQMRPYVVCRSGHAGIQRYAQTWAGDNLTCWEALRYNVATILGMGLSGVANQGCDIGGFYGPAPEAELLVRWIQNGIFQPRFSIHSVNYDNTVTEPWMYPGVTDMVRDAIRLRYQLMPYFYSLMYRAHVKGLPIMEAMCSAFQEDIACYDEGETFMIGDGLLVANVLEKGANSRSIYFPKGRGFYDFWTGKYYDGGQTIEYPVALDTIPMFVAEGGILPMTEEILHPLRDAKMKLLTLRIAPGRDSSFVWYEDDGYTNAYQKGAYLKTTIAMTGNQVVTLDFSQEGDYPSTVEEIRVEFHSYMQAPLLVQLAGKKLTHYLYVKDFARAQQGWYYNIEKGLVEIKYHNPKKAYSLVISFEEFDMIGM